jgi:exodeoxyribonuclease VII large subunit
MRLRYEKCMNSRAYKYPKQYIDDKYVLIDNRMRKIENIVIQKLKDSKLQATKWITKLDTLSPLKTLTRGYCLTECEGKLITNSSELKKDMEVDLKFQDGSKKAIIK